MARWRDGQIKKETERGGRNGCGLGGECRFIFFSQLWCHRVATFNLEFSSFYCKDFHSMTIGAANLRQPAVFVRREGNHLLHMNKSDESSVIDLEALRVQKIFYIYIKLSAALKFSSCTPILCFCLVYFILYLLVS